MSHTLSHKFHFHTKKEVDVVYQNFSSISNVSYIKKIRKAHKNDNAEKLDLISLSKLIICNFKFNVLKILVVVFNFLTVFVRKICSSYQQSQY